MRLNANATCVEVPVINVMFNRVAYNIKSKMTFVLVKQEKMVNVNSPKSLQTTKMIRHLNMNVKIQNTTNSKRFTILCSENILQNEIWNTFRKMPVCYYSEKIIILL